MSATYGSWTGPAKAMATAVDAAVTAAQADDADAFDEAQTQLARVDEAQLRVLLGTVTRELLERGHPDGLDSDDAEAVVTGCLTAASWYPVLAPDAIVRALTDALGVSDPDDAVQLDAAVLLPHGLLLIAHLLTALAQPLPPVLEHALRELQRDQTIEMP